MKVSVVVPAFNQSGYLREALQSALSQTHTDIEVIVVDDGSTDATASVCKSFGDDRLKYVYQDNDGTFGIGARNHAMLLAQGDWIALLDQDDRWAPDKLARQLERANEVPDCGAVFSSVRFIDPEGRVTKTQDERLPEGEVFHRLLQSNPYYAATGMFRRSLLSVTGLPGESAGLADWALWLSLSRHCAVACVQAPLADYRLHPQGYQLASNRRRVAGDQWKTVAAQGPRLHPHCPDCVRSHRRARRGVAKLYLASARLSLAQGVWRGVGGDIMMALVTGPAWILLPWVLLQQVLRLGVAACAGLPKLVSAT